MVGKKLLRTVLLAGALIGGLVAVSGAAPAFAANQSHEPANNRYNQERSYVNGSGRDHDGGRHQRSNARNDRHDRDRDHGRGHGRDRDRDRGQDRH